MADFEDDFEDSLLEIDFDDLKDESKKIVFLEGKAKDVDVEESDEESRAIFYGENNKPLCAKIIEKKSGETTVIKYNLLGGKERVQKWDKDGNAKETITYFENGVVDTIKIMGPNRSYRCTQYNIDGTQVSFIIKHPDGTTDAEYYDADGRGNGTIFLKFDANNNVIDKKFKL